MNPPHPRTPMTGRDDVSLYILTCASRIGSHVLASTLESVARSDWGAEPLIHLDDREDGDPKDRQTASYRRLLERISADRPSYALVLEDDVAVNRHLRANLAAWQPVCEGRRRFLGSLYDPNLRPLQGAPAVDDGFVADPESVYGSQAFLLTPEVADHCLEHWGDVEGMQDIRVSRLAARLHPHAVLVHRPSLVDHAGAALSTHGGTHHTAVDFDPWWRAGRADGALSWEAVHGWFDWSDFYHQQVRALPHGGVVVEVGAFLGRSIIFLAQAMKEARKDLRLHAVDTFVGSPSDPIVRAAVEAHGGSLRAAFDRNLAAAAVDDAVTVLATSSVEAARSFADRSVDLVFLDGDHGEEAVEADVAAWTPKVRPGGTVAGHDIDTYPSVGRALARVLGPGGYSVDHRQNLWFRTLG